MKVEQYWAHEGAWPKFKGKVKALCYYRINTPEIITIEDGSSEQAIFTNVFPMEYCCPIDYDCYNSFMSWVDENNIEKIIWRRLPYEFDGFMILTFYAILEGNVAGRCDPCDLLKEITTY